MNINTLSRFSFKRILNIGSVFNLFCALFVILMCPVLLRATSAVVYQEQRIAWLGWTILLVMILDVVGLYFKLPAIASRSNQQALGSIDWYLALWIGRLIIAALLCGLMLSAFGLAFESPLGALALFASIIKEIVVLGLFLTYLNKDCDIVKCSNKTTPLKEAVSNLVLFVSVAFTYTLTWQAIALNNPLSKYHGAELYFQGFFAVFFFFLIFLPVRMIYFIEDALQDYTLTQSLGYWLSLLLAVAAGLAVLF
jgi:hypothetical protein